MASIILVTGPPGSGKSTVADFVIDDVCVPGHFPEHYTDLLEDPFVKRLALKPSFEALTRRLEQRGGPWDEFFLESGVAAWSYSVLESMPLDGWIVIDSSNQSGEETIDTAINRITDDPD